MNSEGQDPFSTFQKNPSDFYQYMSALYFKDGSKVWFFFFLEVWKLLILVLEPFYLEETIW